MPLQSVQLYVKGILDGLVVPTMPDALKAHITPPTVENLTGPRAHVWGGTLLASRQSGSRGVAPAAGFKRLAWSVDVWLVYLANANDSTLDLQFPALVDAVMTAMWSTRMPLYIDAYGTQVPDDTPGATQILEVGEDFRLEFAPVRAPATARALYYDAHFAFDIYEAVQA